METDKAGVDCPPERCLFAMGFIGENLRSRGGRSGCGCGCLDRVYGCIPVFRLNMVPNLAIVWVVSFSASCFCLSDRIFMSCI